MKRFLFIAVFMVMFVACGSVEQSANDTDIAQHDSDIAEDGDKIDESNDATDDEVEDDEVEDDEVEDDDAVFAPLYQNVSNEEAHAVIDANSDNPDFMIIDVRTESEYASGHIENAVNMNKYGDTFDADLAALNCNGVYLIYCASGARSSGVFTTMQTLEFQEVYNLEHGYNSWE